MAYENSALGEALLSAPMSFPFDKVVAFKVDGEWLAVNNTVEAVRLLADSWPDKSGASHRRALATCQSYLDGRGSAIAARASFSVAVMELGLSLRLFDDAMAFLDFEVEAMTEEEVRRTAD